MSGFIPPVRMCADLKAALVAEAKRQDRSVAWIVRQALLAALGKR